jgi:hypothetical protein
MQPGKQTDKQLPIKKKGRKRKNRKKARQKQPYFDYFLLPLHPTTNF